MKFLNYLALLSILSAIFLIGLITFWLNYNYQPLVFNDPVMPVLTKTVRAGETLRYVSNFCKNTNEPATVSRRFINGIVFATPVIITKSEKGCQEKTVAVSVPLELLEGPYRLSIVYQYKVNPLRTITVVQDTETFEVIK